MLSSKIDTETVKRALEQMRANPRTTNKYGFSLTSYDINNLWRQAAKKNLRGRIYG